MLIIMQFLSTKVLQRISSETRGSEEPESLTLLDKVLQVHCFYKRGHVFHG